MHEIADRSYLIERTRSEFLADGVILCIRLRRREEVLEACRAALSGGLRILEITLTTPGALDVIETLASEGKALVGGGTVLSADDARAVAARGGHFALSPVFDPEVVDEAHRLGLLAVPGTATPREILAAHRHGARLVKVFPAGALGGPAYIRSVRGPLPDIPLIPTSGPSAQTLAEYMSAGAVAVGVGAEVFGPGYTPASAEAAARRLREAMDGCRRAAGAP